MEPFGANLLLGACKLLKRWSGRRGSNPRRPAWEAGILPLNYSRNPYESVTSEGSLHSEHQVNTILSLNQQPLQLINENNAALDRGLRIHVQAYIDTMPELA